MSKHLALVLPLLVIIGIGLVLFAKNNASPGQTPTQTSTAATQQPARSYLDATYLIDGTPVTLSGGHASVPAAPGSASMVTTDEYGSQEVAGDLNDDGMGDVAFILVQSGGGSGTFYYAVVALSSGAGYIGTNAVLLGDRIAMQSMQVSHGQFIVNYLDRASSDPMSAGPSIPATKYLQITNGQLVAALPAAN